MAEDGLTDYERLRQENISRNEVMLAPVRRKADELSRLSAAIHSAKPKRSCRSRPGNKPDTPGPTSSIVLRSARLPRSTQLSSSLASSVLGSASSPAAKTLADDFDAARELVLKHGHVRRVVTSSILSLRVLPLVDRTVVAAGDIAGNIGFWDVDAASEGQVLFRYTPHKSPVSAIVAHPAAPHKIYSSSYRGEICLMDFEEENFNMLHLGKCPIYSLCEAQDSVRCIYFGDESGDLTLFDERVGKVLTTWDVHDRTIESIVFHPENKHMLATSSADGSACIWDVRNMKKKQPDSLKVFKLNDSAQSAYFSPSGHMLAVTSSSRCGTVQVFSVDDFEKSHTVEYNNQTDSWPNTFKVIWGWNDAELYVGNMRIGIDIISVEANDCGISAQNSSYLRSRHMPSVPCQFSVHPYKVGYLACSDSHGNVFLWTRV